LTAMQVSEFHGWAGVLLDGHPALLRIRPGLAEGLLLGTERAKDRANEVREALLHWLEQQPDSPRRFRMARLIVRSSGARDRYLRLLELRSAPTYLHQESGRTRHYLEECLWAANGAPERLSWAGAAPSRSPGDRLESCGREFGTFFVEWMRRSGTARQFSEGHDEGSLARIALSVCALLELIHVESRGPRAWAITSFLCGWAPGAAGIPSALRAASSRQGEAAVWASRAGRVTELIRRDGLIVDPGVDAWLQAMQESAS
jgi:hypothetical protein